jgi:hypothetical protein
MCGHVRLHTSLSSCQTVLSIIPPLSLPPRSLPSLHQNPSTYIVSYLTPHAQYHPQRNTHKNITDFAHHHHHHHQPPKGPRNSKPTPSTIPPIIPALTVVPPPPGAKRSNSQTRKCFKQHQDTSACGPASAWGKVEVVSKMG